MRDLIRVIKDVVNVAGKLLNEHIILSTPFYQSHKFLLQLLMQRSDYKLFVGDGFCKTSMFSHLVALSYVLISPSPASHPKRVRW